MKVSMKVLVEAKSEGMTRGDAYNAWIYIHEQA